VTIADRALLIYTSGTTGLPKAANISHRRPLQWSFWFAGLMNATPHDRMYVISSDLARPYERGRCRCADQHRADCLPLYHSVGGVVATGALLVRGGSVLIRDRFSVRHFWDDVFAGNCTIFQYIGELCRYLVNAPEHPHDRAHRLRLCCGNGLQADIWKKFQDRFTIPRILEFYASTEGNVSLYNVEGKIGSIGRVPPFLASRFPLALVQFEPATGRPARDTHGFCIRCGVNETGEAISSAKAASRLSATIAALFGCPAAGAMTANSSPPSRARKASSPSKLSPPGGILAVIGEQGHADAQADAQMLVVDHQTR
jgi:fatty-acyl-CoA synthase